MCIHDAEYHDVHIIVNWAAFATKDGNCPYRIDIPEKTP